MLPPAPLALQGWCFGVMGQRLATRIRILILRALLRQVSAGGGGTTAGALHRGEAARGNREVLSPAVHHSSVVLLPASSPQDISFFDAPENSSGALLSALASDAASVRGAVGDRVGHILTLLSCVVGSYVIAFKSRCETLDGRARAACHLLRLRRP